MVYDALSLRSDVVVDRGGLRQRGEKSQPTDRRRGDCVMRVNSVFGFTDSRSTYDNIFL